MMRTLFGSGIVSIALLALSTSMAFGPKKPPVPPQPTPDGFSSVRIVEDANVRRFISVGRDCIRDRDWKLAIEALQPVLEQKNDYYVKVAERDPADPKKEITRWASVKFEANNLIGSMPAEGLDAYEQKHGAEANKLFEAAKKKNDPELLAEVAQRFRHTKAGSEAHELRVKQFNASAAAEVINVKDWRSWRGNVTNTGQAIGGPPLLDKPLFSRPIFNDQIGGFADPDQKAEARVKGAIKQVSDANQAVLPGFFPVAAQGIMVYRSHRDIRAVALKEINIKDEEFGNVAKIKPGEIVWKSIPMNRSLALLLEKNNLRPKVDQWLDGAGQLQGYNAVPGFSSLLYENTLLGTLSVDGRNVYAVNDIGVPPHPAVFMANPFNAAQVPGDTKPLIMQNELHAYDLVYGKLQWDLSDQDPQFKDSHFLSLPISVGGKLYVLNEKLIDRQLNLDPFGGGPPNLIPGESEMRLVCIDPNKLIQVKANIKPTIVGPIQVLGNVVQENRMVQDISRRVNAVQLAYSDGVLVCPTNAGEVFGIDLMTRTLVWSYPYRESPRQPIMLPGMAPPMPPLPGQPKPLAGTTIVSKWKSSPPAIQAGRIVFTAPDADSVHCINLKDGKLAWKRAQKKGDLYMAGVFDGRVLIVSETNICALDLKDGSQLWALATGDLPSGQGVASKGIYYLPLKKSEVVAIDIAKGQIKAHNRGAAGMQALGNLVFYENMVLSQSPTDVVAFPQLRAKLDEGKNPPRP